MPIATDQQVQAFSDQRVRPHMEAIRALVLALQDDKASIDDVYAACAAQNPTWTDTRSGGAPPHLLAPSDILEYNAFITAIISAITGNGSYPTVIKACVRPVQVQG